mmetsp:Transcript_93681/g.205040  ORF Transcript_93681/g.205040 Transcript_93681/m.205040 type:complete len:302 (-) Transcript_93681:2-907(-)
MATSLPLTCSHPSPYAEPPKKRMKHSEKCATSPAFGTSGSSSRKFEIGIEEVECPICQESMVGRVLQCPIGHSICEDCFRHIHRGSNLCPCCKRSYPAEVTRNLILETIASRLRFPCRFGCGLVGTPAELRPHHQACAERLWPCPIEDCKHHAHIDDLRRHLLEAHRWGPLDTPDSEDTGMSVFVFDGASCNGVIPLNVAAESGEYANLIMLDDDDTPALLQDRSVEDGHYWCKVCHFDKPFRFHLGIQSGNRSLHLVGLSQSLSEEEYNIKLAVSMLKDFPSTNGKWQLNMKIEPMEESL